MTVHAARGGERRANPHSPHATSLPALAGSIWRNRQLVAQMARRDVVGRYKGSFMGMAWSFLHPLFMLAVYTFVFSEIFKARWGVAGGGDSRIGFAMVLFAGIIVLTFFTEVLNRAPVLVLGSANYVKKVVFPLEILPVVSVCAALFHAAVSTGVLLLALLALQGSLPWTVLLFPLVLLPLVVLTVGIACALASLGVFLRDVGQTMGIFTAALMFLSPVFFPVSAVPPAFQPWLLANPLTFIIEQSRDVLLWGRAPDWVGLAQYLLAALVVAWAGFAWFQKTRKGFADVL